MHKIKQILELIYRNKRALLALSIVCPILLIIVGLFFNTWEGKRFVIFYMAPLFTCIFLWTYLKIEQWSSNALKHASVDFAVIVLSILRFFEFAPFSGHMLFGIYTGLTIKNKLYRGLIALLLLESTYFKLVVWDDEKSWLLGIILGLLFALLNIILGKR